MLIQNIRLAAFPVFLMWTVHILNLLSPVDLRSYGIHPRQVESLRGIAFMPFLHGNFAHLAANTGALIILLVLSLTYDRKRTFWASLMICIISGACVWLLGAENTVHIGASGLIFGLIGFLLFIGVFRREWKSILLSLIVGFFYGGALFSLLVHVPGVSWTGHFFGFLAGIFSAWCMRR